MFPSNRFLTPPEKQNRFGRWAEQFALCFFALMNLIILYQFLTTQLGGWPVLDYVLAIAYVLGAVLVCALIVRTGLQSAYVLPAVLLLSLAVRLLYVVVIPTLPGSDFELMYEAAQASAKGDFSWSHVSSGYFYQWGYQIPFVLYEGAVLWLFRSIFALKVLNVLFMVGSNYLLYRIGRLFLSDAPALCITFLYAVFPGAVMLASVLTNQHIALFFLLLGAFLLLRSDRWQDMLLAGLSLSISDLMRPEAVIILTAMFCCGLLRCIQQPNVAAFKRFVMAVALAFGSYWAVKTVVGSLLVWVDIAPNGIGNRVPEWKFVCGLGNIEGFGSYSEEHIAILSMEGAARREACAEIVGALFQRPPGEILHFFVGKINRFWTSPQSPSWSLWNLDAAAEVVPGLEVQAFRSYLQSFERGMLLLVYLLALPAGPILLMQAGRQESGQQTGRTLFCIIAVCITICAYLLIEIQTRYRYSAIPFWLLIGSITVEWLAQRQIHHKHERQ